MRDAVRPAWPLTHPRRAANASACLRPALRAGAVGAWDAAQRPGEQEKRAPWAGSAPLGGDSGLPRLCPPIGEAGIVTVAVSLVVVNTKNDNMLSKKQPLNRVHSQDPVTTGTTCARGRPGNRPLRVLEGFPNGRGETCRPGHRAGYLLRGVTSPGPLGHSPRSASTGHRPVLGPALTCRSGPHLAFLGWTLTVSTGERGPRRRRALLADQECLWAEASTCGIPPQENTHRAPGSCQGRVPALGCGEQGKRRFCAGCLASRGGQDVLWRARDLSPGLQDPGPSARTGEGAAWPGDSRLRPLRAGWGPQHFHLAGVSAGVGGGGAKEPVGTGGAGRLRARRAGSGHPQELNLDSGGHLSWRQKPSLQCLSLPFPPHTPPGTPGPGFGVPAAQ